jgi:hypothetical protein
VNHTPDEPNSGKVPGDGGAEPKAPAGAGPLPPHVAATTYHAHSSQGQATRQPPPSAAPIRPPQELLEESRKQLNRLLEEIGRMTEADIPPPEFFGEFLKRMRQAMNAKGGAVWCRTPQGNLQLQFQIEMHGVGINQNDESRQSHDELLRQAMNLGKQIHLPPHASAGSPQGKAPAPGNPTDFILLIVPILLDKQVLGLVEIWQMPDRHPSTIPGFLQFMTHLADLASRYLRNQTTNQLAKQQALWGQLEGFSRQIHASLKPTEVAYSIANEARRIVECDRISVAVRYGRRCKVEAISGADQVESRSNLVKLMRALFDSVIQWGEKLVFTGAKDESLPPRVHQALNAFLEESNSRVLVVVPLRDEREKDSHRPPRSAILMECFDPQAAPEQLIARLEVVGKHCAPALYNAVEHKRIPFRFIWVPMAKVQEGLGGKAKAITMLIAAAVIIAVLAFIFVPYPLKVEATGELQPQVWANVYPPTECRIDDFMVKDPRLSDKDQAKRTYPENFEAVLVTAPKLGPEITNLKSEVDSLSKTTKSMKALLDAPQPADRGQLDRASLWNEYNSQERTLRAKQDRLTALQRDYHANPANSNQFFILLPSFPPGMREHGLEWTVLNSGFDNLAGKEVKPSESILRVGYIVKAPGADDDPNWQVELKIPQKHIGQVLKAFGQGNDAKEFLDVDLLVKSAPTQVFKGRLFRSKVAGEARPQQNDNNENEPVVYAYVQIHDNEGNIPKADQIPEELLQTGTEVHAKIRCGSHALGYSLFYGLWEFFYEKVVFFF